MLTKDSADMVNASREGRQDGGIVVPVSATQFVQLPLGKTGKKFMLSIDKVHAVLDALDMLRSLAGRN